MKIQKKTNGYHHGALAEACVKQGLKFLSQGQRDFSSRDIAKALNVSHGAPSKHFGSKEALMAAIAEEGFRALNRVLKESIIPDDPNRTFYNMGQAYLSFALKHPDHYRVMLGDKIPDHQKYEKLNDEAGEAFSHLVSLITNLQAQKKVMPGNPTMVAYTIWSGVHGLAMLAIEGHLHVDAQQTLRTMGEAMLTGLGNLQQAPT